MSNTAMDLKAKLSDLGFKSFEVLNETKGLARVRTSRGWTYEKFSSEDQIDSWSKFHKPEDK